MDERSTVVRLPKIGDAAHQAMLRRVNKGLMVNFINHDLLNRAHLDVRKSIVLYDEAGVFEYAMAEMPNEETLRKLYANTEVRYWSKGIK